MASLRSERDGPSLLRGLVVRCAAGRRQKLDRVGRGGLDHGAVPPGEPATHAQVLAGERRRIEPGGGKGGGILAGNADGEVAAPILGEIQIEAATAFADVEHPSLDELIRMNETPETLGVARVFDAI